MDSRCGEVVETLTTCFNGLCRSNTGRLARVFHPPAVDVTAREAAANGGRPVHPTMGDDFPIVDARIAPVDLVGPVTAFAHVECAIVPKFFTDFLTLIRVAEFRRHQAAAAAG